LNTESDEIQPPAIVDASALCSPETPTIIFLSVCEARCDILGAERITSIETGRLRYSSAVLCESAAVGPTPNEALRECIRSALRNRKFFSLAELNQAIRELLVRLNERSFRKRDGSRASVFHSLEKPALAVAGRALRHESVVTRYYQH
jgi:hypothetical protein